MRTLDRGSTTGAASWTDHERSEWAARRASAASQSLPVPDAAPCGLLVGWRFAYPTYKIKT